MDHPETDRMLADELKGILKELRDKNKKLTDEKDSAENFNKLAWVIVAVVLAAVVMTMCGDGGHHHYRY